MLMQKEESEKRAQKEAAVAQQRATEKVQRAAAAANYQEAAWLQVTFLDHMDYSVHMQVLLPHGRRYVSSSSHFCCKPSWWFDCNLNVLTNVDDEPTADVRLIVVDVHVTVDNGRERDTTALEINCRIRHHVSAATTRMMTWTPWTGTV